MLHCNVVFIYETAMPVLRNRVKYCWNWKK